MRYNLELKEEAIEELSDAYQFYKKERKGLEEDFLAVLEKTFHGIQDQPYRYPARHKNRRIAVVQKYPFVIIFEIEEENTITVYAVFHTSRSPKIWKKRK
jgi:plasmid stabilization system protein ParE